MNVISFLYESPDICICLVLLQNHLQLFFFFFIWYAHVFFMSLVTLPGDSLAFPISLYCSIYVDRKSQRMITSAPANTDSGWSLYLFEAVFITYQWQIYQYRYKHLEIRSIIYILINARCRRKYYENFFTRNHHWWNSHSTFCFPVKFDLFIYYTPTMISFFSFLILFHIQDILESFFYFFS